MTPKFNQGKTNICFSLDSSSISGIDAGLSLIWCCKHTSAALFYLNPWKTITFCKMLFRAQVLPVRLRLGLRSCSENILHLLSVV